MHRTATRLGLIVTVAIFAAAKVAAQESAVRRRVAFTAQCGSEEAAVKRMVDGIMQPYLAQEQRMVGGH